MTYSGSSPSSRRSYITETTVPGSSTWTDYAVQARVKVESSTDPYNGWGMLMARWQDSKNYYYLALEDDGDVKIRKYVNESSTTMDSTGAGLALDTWYTVTLEVSGSPTPTLRALINGTPVITVTDDTGTGGYGGAPPYTAGPCAVGSYKGTVQFDDVVVTDLGTPATLFSDDFNDGNDDDWTVQAGDWSVVPENYVYYHDYDGSPTTARSYVDSPVLTDYAIQSRVKVLDGQYGMLLARYQDDDNYYFMTLRGDDGKVQVRRYLNGSSSGGTLGEVSYGIITGTWYTAKLKVSGSTLRAYIDGTPVITATDSTFITGTVGLGTVRADAHFDDVVITDLQIFTLTVSITGTGSGSVTSNPAGIDCGITCTANFESSTVVTLTATPSGSDSFAGWMGACTGTGNCVVTMDATKAVTAVFSSPSNPMLVVNKAGTGVGSVTSDPAGIDCGNTCAASFAASTVVTLTATPDAYSTFTGWSGDCAGTGDCVVTMDTAKNVTATFFQNPILNVTKDGNGSGSITSDPAGIDCGLTCTARFAPSTVVTLTATPAVDSVFGGWSGAGCSGTGTCVVTMAEDTDVTATFNLITYTLTVNRAGNGMGSVLSDPEGINNCSTVTCTAVFDISTVVTLTATANTFSSFDGWSGEGCSGTGSCVVTMDADKNVTASYSTYLQYFPLIMKSGGTPPTGPDFSMVGYATMNGGTTGGTGGTEVAVTTLDGLRQYAQDADNPYIIKISGTISTTAVGNDARVRVKSNKTIVGLGSSGELIGVWLSIDEGISNVIIRNLKISKVVGYDAIHIQGPNTHHIWIDHCDLSSDTTSGKDYYDGLIDITHAVDYVTISWTKFHDHWKTSLIGHSDGNATEDTGHFLITYHHNYFYNVNSRLPSNRFGTLHSYNNYFNNTNKSSNFDANSGISSRMGACSRIENNYFAGFGMAIMTDQSPTLGGVQLIDNTFVNCTGYATSPTCTLTPPYAYASTLHSTVAVPSIVTQYAGVGKVTDPLVW
jgi:pectate lyase